MGLLTEWPPAAEQYYLPLDSARPIFQGDVFDNVPFAKVRGGKTPDSDPEINIECRRVCALLYPCDIYNPEGVMAQVQAVAVLNKEGPGYKIPKNWDGSFNLCPYPNLDGDDAMWFADFRTTANVDQSYLSIDNRVASLSLLGWSYFRLRITLNYTRSGGRLEYLMDSGAEIWRELEFWQEWSRLRGSGEGFHKWWNTACIDLSGFKPHDVASRQGMLADVEQLMRAEIASLTVS